jgi:dual specificity phosphatase 12
MMYRNPGLGPTEALELLRKARPLCEPNDGFMTQLEVYHNMGCPRTVTDHPMYQRWLYQRAVEESVACGRGPELEEIRFEDETVPAPNGKTEDREDDNAGTEIRCRKCR